MTSRVLVVLMVDGLRARALGAYGNTMHGTPAFDRLASRATAFDRMLAESNDLNAIYNALWTGRHTLEPSPADSLHLIERLTSDGYLCHLLTDEVDVAERDDLQHFDQVTRLDASATKPADDVWETTIGRTMSAAADRLGEWSAEYEQPRLLWVHLSGLTAPWDAPPELAEGLLDEEDPDLIPSLEVPNGAVAEGHDAADEVLLAASRYAGQVMALDAAVGGLDQLLGELWPETPVELVLAGTRGFALGEHGWLGIDAPTAHRELFQVPLIVRGSNVPPLQRQASLVQTSDLYALLAELATSGALPRINRPQARGGTQESRYVETDGWSYVTPWPRDEEDTGELYVQPDDQWQANDVASICHEEAERMAGMVDYEDT